MEHPKSNTQICIVDDELEIAELCSEMLGARYETHCFASVKAALREYERVRIPDVLITDLKMPGMSGADFIAHLRGQRITRPIIVISGHWDMIEALRGQDKEVLAFLKKPFSAPELRAAVARAEEVVQAQRFNEALVARFVQLFDSTSPVAQELYERVAKTNRLLTDAHFRRLSDPSQVMPELGLHRSFKERATLALRSREVVSELLRIRRELLGRKS